MRQALFATLLAPLVLAAAPASAADLPRGSSPGYYSPTPVANWQGFYAGVNGGYGFGSFNDGSNSLLGFPSGGFVGSNALLGNPSGGLVGFTAGYNYMIAPNFLIGIESDFDFSGMKTSQSPFFGVSTSSSVNDLLTIRGRVGYTVDRALFFITGGFAGSNNSATINSWWAPFYGQQSTFQTGWALGAGAEFLVAPNLSVKAEYLFTSVGSDRYFAFSPDAIQTSVNNSQVKAGVNYHF